MLGHDYDFLFILQPCENCPDLPILLVGTKSDLWRDRQVGQEAARAAARRFSCAHFKEVRHTSRSVGLITSLSKSAYLSQVSTRESADEVAEVFEQGCRQGWLFRQHRELTKHRSMSIVGGTAASGGVGGGVEKAVSLDCG